ncbi:MAG TPA: isoprenylcysteine carboxylmethyltransferase family protein [Methanothrix soehngenii]|nr:isoprenylcysteine carboxylmethyltransferase family protein [Methanothrix soehngenii]
MIDIEEQRLRMLRRQAMIRFGLAAVLIPIILYALAGTLRYWQGCLYWMVIIAPMLVAVSYLLKHEPELLERRMKYRERESEQQKIVSVGAIIFVVGFIAIAADLRLHGLDAVPVSWILAADAGVFLGYLLVLWVFKENSYACRTIEVVVGQRVITSGPYAIIRHPMYLGVLLMYLLTPIALGSLWAVPIFSLFIPLLVWRIIEEEKILLRDLPGYAEYCRERRYRLLPHIW